MEEMVAKSIPCLVLSCLQHTDTHFYFKNELMNLRESDMFESISDTVMHFYIAYDAEYKRIVENIFKDPYFMKSKSRFLAKIRSRCLLMCDSPTFFNFLLMCAFVGRVTTFCYEIGKCYRVAENACKCAIAVFQRKFLELFNREGGLEGLWAYSNCLNETVLDKQDECKDLKDILTPDPRSKEHVLSLLNDCEVADFGEYYLTRFERKLLYNVTVKQLKKLKSGLDCLMYHIPRKYFQTLNHGSRNTVFKAFGSNELNQRAECSLCSSPIECKMKKYSQPSITRIIEKQSELSDCSIITKQSAASNAFIDRKEIESPNNNFSDFSSKHTIPEGSLPLVYDGMSQEEQSSTSDESFSLEPESAFEFSRIPKLNFDEALKLGSQKQENAVRRRHFLPFQTSPDRDVVTLPENPEISTSPRGKCLHFLSFETSPERDVTFLKKPEVLSSPHGESSLATHCNLSQNELVPLNLYTDQKTTQLPMSLSSFEEESSDANRCQLEIKTESSKNYSIPSDDVSNSRSHPSTNYGACIPFHFGTEAKSSSGMTDFFPAIHDNIFHSNENRSSARFCQDESSFTTTYSKIALAIDNSDHQGKKNQVSLSKKSSFSAIQHSSDGYFASESNISDNKHISGNEESNISGNEEFQSKISLRQTPALIHSYSSSTERKDSESGTITLKPLIIHKCFHCGKQSPTKFCQCKLSFTATLSNIATVNDSSGIHGSRHNQISTFSLSSKSPSTSSIQDTSDGYFASDSNVSDLNEKEEFHAELFPFQISTFTNLENAPSEREYYYIDWEGDTTLKSLMNHKCFHCGTKCFNYIIYAFQQFTSHSLD